MRFYASNYYEVIETRFTLTPKLDEIDDTIISRHQTISVGLHFLKGQNKLGKCQDHFEFLPKNML